MKNLKLLFLVLITSQTAWAQTLATQSIGSMGYAPASTNMPTLHWNVGEVAIGLVGGTEKINQGLYQVIDISTAIKDPSYSNDLVSLWPSPTTGVIHLQGENDDRLDLRIYNPSGRLVSEMSINGRSDQISIAQFPPEVYYIQIINSQGESQLSPIVLIK